MTEPFSNVYDDRTRSEAYASLEFPGTYYLAYRDLPAIIRKHVHGTKAVDFGCGTGRSTRFLRGLGFDVVGVDISQAMLAHARERDPTGDYRLVPDGDLGGLPRGAHDLVLAAFTFDNVPTSEKKVALFRSLAGLLRRDGRIVTVVSSPDIYVNEWVSFSTQDFPENRTAQCGDVVRIVMLDVPDRRPVEDIVWTDQGYREVYQGAGLVPLETHRPLGDPTEPFHWAAETTVAPWVVYVLAPAP
jgi:SAM-dependent methyltransferase